MNDLPPDPLIPQRLTPGEASVEMKERIMAVLAPYSDKLHLAEMRLEVQQKLEKEFGVVVIIKDPMEGLDRAQNIPNAFQIRDYAVSTGTEAQDRKPNLKKQTIPIPGYRRKRWE